MKRKFKRHLIFILFLIILSISISGCEEKPSAEEVVSNMQMKMDGLEDYSFTMYINSSFQEHGVETQKVIWKKPDFMKTIIRVPDKGTEVIMVSDGEFQWIYNPESETVFKTELSDDFYGLKFFEPNVYAEFLNGTLNGKTASLLGAEDIDKKNAYLLELTPSENNKSSLQGESKIWVDMETWMPLRWEVYNNREITYLAIEIQDMKLNSGIPDSEFEFEIPDGAQVKVLVPEDFKIEPKKMTLEETKQLADFEILIPEYIPEGYEFSYSMFFSSEDSAYSIFIHSGFSAFAGQHYNRITLVYTKGDDEIRITESVSEKDLPEIQDFESQGEYIFVNNKKGMIYPVFGGNMKALTWQNEGLEVTIISSLDEAELFKIAESLS